jgi:hypothetical protein
MKLFLLKKKLALLEQTELPVNQVIADILFLFPPEEVGEMIEKLKVRYKKEIKDLSKPEFKQQKLL